MVEFKRILCPTDLSESAGRALACAATLARWYEAALTVLHVVPTFDPVAVRPTALDGTLQFVHPPSHDEVVGELGRVVAAAGADEARLSVEALSGDPVGTIIDHAVAMPADLLVIGTHGRGGFERLMMGSVAEKLLRKAPCPVLTVPPHATGVLPAEVQFKKILCPMDFSPAALQAYGFALDLARQADGSVTVLHVVEWLPEHEPRTTAHFNVSEYRGHLVGDARQRVQELSAGESRTWSDIDNVVVVGRAHREILRHAADAAADLIVMGAQGRGGLGLTLFGSTTQQVVRNAECPVLTVRAAEPGQVA
ncbi:MAG TPA: universal stress protein [Vicinamibacterales bacterium]|nr:universal stress protein [Vicinamibacterales bacterium]